MWKCGALFAGIGGFCLGFRDAGITTAWAVENDAHASTTYRENFPNTRLISEDVTDVGVLSHGLEPVDILTAGFPCQSFSQAGTRQGFEDPRGELFFQVIRLIEEFGADRPKVLVLENAPFLQYGEGGTWFMRISNAIRKAGYWFKPESSRILDSFELTEPAALKYCRKRWPIPSDDNVAAKHVRQHFFARDKRQIERDNALSRLWWMAHLCSRVEGISLDEALEAFLFKTDVRANLIERPTSSQTASVFSAVIKQLHKSYGADRALFERNRFRGLMRGINAVGGYRLLEFLETQEVEALVVELTSQ